jgi:spermidine/putrescine transport system substrate-binding protein
MDADEMETGLALDEFAGTPLRCLCWEGYADGSLPSDFRRATGFGVSGENHLSDDAASREILNERGCWDIININTPFVRDVLHPAGAIRPLADRFAACVDKLAAPFSRFKAAVAGGDGRILGIPQRFGPFNLVINQNRLSASLAREQGFRLALDPGFRGRFGVLTYVDFNVMHIAIAAGLNPFESLEEAAFPAFGKAAATILKSAHLCTDDHHLLNTRLIDGDIDFYISGGTYTASPARLAGRHEVRAITPTNGPIAGKGAVAFVEVNAILEHGPAPVEASAAFLDFISSSEGAVAASLAAGACNPVVQMSEPAVHKRFTREQLEAMQWDDLQEDLSYCADYAITPDYSKLLAILQSSR